MRSRSLAIPMFALVLAHCQHFCTLCHSQTDPRHSSLDNVGDDFFGATSSTEVVGSLDFVESAERPKPPELLLPSKLDEVPVQLSSDLSPELQAWIRWLVLQNLPPVYEDNRKWGKTEEVYNGFRFRREGMKIETYTKYRTVKQGTWSRYFIEFVDPANKLEISIDEIRPMAADKFAFRINIRTPLKVFGRITQWQRDIQLISVSTNADATVAMKVNCECGVQINPLTFPPDVHFRPKIKDANIVLEHFEVHRISQLRGSLADTLGQSLKGALDDKLASYNEKLVEKINRKLEKQQDRLTLKLHDRLNETIKGWTTGTSPKAP